jgi:hypothetical protein
LLNEKELPEGRSQAGHDWMRRRAVEILGYLGSPGQNNSVLTAFDAILTDNKTPVALRCSAAEAFGRLRFPANAKVAVPDVAKKLATVAAFACQKELQRVEDQEGREAKDALPQPGMGSGYPGMGSGYPDPAYGGMSEMMPGGMPGYGMPSGIPAAKFNPLGYRILLTRRRIAHEMLLVKRGLLGPDATLKAGPSAAAKTSPSAPPPPPKAGLAALVRAGADQTAIDNAVSGIDAIIREVEKSTFNEMKPLITELQCGIVVELPDELVPGATPDALLSSPVDLPEGMPGLEMPAVAGEPPAAEPADQPAAPAPDIPAPAVPVPADAPEPNAGETPKT